jgi:hypothetical protein
VVAADATSAGFALDGVSLPYRVPLSSANFPSGACGCGLLGLRLVLAASVMAEGAALLVRDLSESHAAALTVAADALLVLCGAFTGLGLLTPVVQTVVAAVKLASISEWIWHLAASAGEAAVQVLVFQLAVSASLALLGPGAYSVDARVFGRHEIHIPPRAQFPTR